MVKSEIQSVNPALSKKHSVLTRTLIHLLAKALKRPFYHKLTAKRAFYRWHVFTKSSLVKTSVIELFRRSHITPTKAIWMLFHQKHEPAVKMDASHRKEVISAGLTILSSMSRRSALAKLLRGFSTLKQHKNLPVLELYSLEPLSYLSEGGGDDNTSKGLGSDGMGFGRKRPGNGPCSFRHIQLPQADMRSIFSSTVRAGQGFHKLHHLMKIRRLKDSADLFAKLKSESGDAKCPVSILNHTLKAVISRRLSSPLSRILIGPRKGNTCLYGLIRLTKIISKKMFASAFESLFEASGAARRRLPGSDYLSLYQEPFPQSFSFQRIKSEAERPSKETKSNEGRERLSTKTEVNFESMQRTEPRHRSFGKMQLNRVYAEMIKEGLDSDHVLSGTNQETIQVGEGGEDGIERIYFEANTSRRGRRQQRSWVERADRVGRAARVLGALVVRRIGQAMKKLTSGYEMKRMAKLIKVLSRAGNRVDKVLARCFSLLRLQTVKRDWLISIMLATSKLRSVFKLRMSNYFMWLKLEERVKNYRLCYNSVWMWKLKHEESKRFTVERRYGGVLEDKQGLVQRAVNALIGSLARRTLHAFLLLKTLQCKPSLVATSSDGHSHTNLVTFMAKLLLSFDRFRLQRLRSGMHTIATSKNRPVCIPRKCIKSRLLRTFVGSPETTKVSWNLAGSSKLIQRLKGDIVTPREWNDRKNVGSTSSFKSPQSYSTEVNLTEGASSKAVYSIRERLNLEFLSKNERNKSDLLASTNRSESMNPLFKKSIFPVRNTAKEEQNDSSKFIKLTTDHEKFKGIWSTNRKEFLSFRSKNGHSRLETNRTISLSRPKRRTTMEILGFKRGVKLLHLLLQKNLREAIQKIKTQGKSTKNDRNSVQSQSPGRFLGFGSIRPSEPTLRISEWMANGRPKPEKPLKKTIFPLNLSTLKDLNRDEDPQNPRRFSKLIPSSLASKVKRLAKKWA
jgi:hypothetical protein